MRKSLVDLVEKTIVYRYDLPNTKIGAKKTKFSTENDKCYVSLNSKSISEIIYNSIVEYSFNEFDIKGKDYENLHTTALKIRLKYNSKAPSKTKISYGFHGETLLYCILYVMFKAKPLISRGFFYNPLESSETKGYDSYQLIENNGKTELWFGEVKFRSNSSSSIKSALDNIQKAISDDYFSKNLYALPNHVNNFNIKDSVIEKIIDGWLKKPQINIIEEVKKHKIKLVYPIMIMYEAGTSTYDDNIKKALKHIDENYKKKAFKLSIEYSIFFILIPMQNVKEIKSDVIKWIESKKSLMS